MIGRAICSLAGAAALVAAASAAHAQPAKGTPIEFSVRSEPSALSPTGKSLKWDTHKGRWGVTLNMDQPGADRDVQWNDVQAGAYFRVTPQLRIGGAVALGEKETPAHKKTEPEGAQPRVRLETAFKF